MRVVEHVRTGIQNCLGDDIIVIGDQQTTFAGVDVLVCLGAEAPDFSECSRISIVPVATHGVGTVFNQK